jgi:hypothetical protein
MSERLTIGNITSGYRSIRSGKEYDKYFPQPDKDDRVIIEDGEVDDTVDLMKRVVWKYIDDTKKLAPVLKGKSTQETAQNIWDFLYHHIQYKLDKQGLEQLRRPARSWNERSTGIDCDCFSIFCSSILTNLQIPHSFRITKYDGPFFQHVYVIIPHKNGKIIIDPVLSKFNYEKPYSQKKDFTMNLSGIDVAVLSGVDTQMGNVLFGTQLGDNLEGSSPEQQLEAMYKYLVETRNAIAHNPNSIQHYEDPEAFVKMLDYAIQYWNTDKRDEALSILAMNELQLNDKYSLSGDEGLGSIKSFFSKVGSYVKSTAKKVGSAVKDAAKVVIRYNPLTATARAGLLMAMKLNMKNMASKLKWGYATASQAAQHGISSTQHRRIQSALAKVEKLFADKLQGTRSGLKKAILGGKAGGLNGTLAADAHNLGQLGEPISMSAAIVAATPVIIATIKIMKDSGLFASHEDTDTSNLTSDAKQAQSTASNPNTPVIIPDPMYNPLPSTDPYAAYATDSNSGGMVNLAKNNPLLIVAGVGVLGAATYFIVKSRKKKPTRRGLSGTSRKRSTGTRSRSASSRRKSSTKRIKRVTLK